jgi:hypothetical protein
MRHSPSSDCAVGASSSGSNCAVEACTHHVGTSWALSIGLFCILEEKICNRCPRISRTQFPLKFQYCTKTARSSADDEGLRFCTRLNAGARPRGWECQRNQRRWRPAHRMVREIDRRRLVRGRTILKNEVVRGCHGVHHAGCERASVPFLPVDARV